MFLPYQPQRRNQSPVKYRRWSFFKSLLVLYIVLNEKSFNRWGEVSIILNNYTLQMLQKQKMTKKLENQMPFRYWGLNTRLNYLIKNIYKSNSNQLNFVVWISLITLYKFLIYLRYIQKNEWFSSLFVIFYSEVIVSELFNNFIH